MRLARRVTIAVMFEGIDRPSRGVPFILQLLLVYPCAALLAWPLLSLYDHELAVHGFGRGGDPMYALDAVFFAAAGLLLGWIAGRRWPQLRVSGRWIWIVPAVIFLWEFLPAWISPCRFCSDAKMLFFYSDGRDEGLSSALFTWPAVSIGAYSLAMYLVRRRILHAPAA